MIIRITWRPAKPDEYKDPKKYPSKNGQISILSNRFGQFLSENGTTPHQIQFLSESKFQIRPSKPAFLFSARSSSRAAGFVVIVKAIYNGNLSKTRNSPNQRQPQVSVIRASLINIVLDRFLLFLLIFNGIGFRPEAFYQISYLRCKFRVACHLGSRKRFYAFGTCVKPLPRVWVSWLGSRAWPANEIDNNEACDKFGEFRVAIIVGEAGEEVRWKFPKSEYYIWSMAG